MAGAAAVYDPVASRANAYTSRLEKNRVEGQSCCAAVLTSRLRHTEGSRRPRGILHMKRVWNAKHSFFYLFWPFVQARTMGRGFLEVPTDSC